MKKIYAVMFCVVIAFCMFAMANQSSLVVNAEGNLESNLTTNQNFEDDTVIVVLNKQATFE